MSESPNDDGESPSSGSYNKYQGSSSGYGKKPDSSYERSSSDYGESPDGESPSNGSSRKYRR